MLSRFAGSFWRAQGVRLAIFVMAAAALATGQITFNDFQSTTGLTLNGDAARSGNVLRLTPAAVGKVGSAWFNNAQTVNQGFTTKFTFQFSQPNPAGDGIAFVIQNSGAGALGGGGGSIGYGAIGPCPDGPSTCSGGIIDSVAIEFDTFNNGAATGDPAQNHIAVQSGGIGETNCPAHVSPNTDDFPNCLIGTVSTIGTNMSDGNPHTVVIDYAAPSCDGDCGPGTLTVKLDDVTVLTTNLTLENEMNLSEGGTALVGFTSATGSAFENHDILNWVFTPHGQTMTIGPLHTSGGHTTVFSFGTFNFKSAPATTISAAGDDLTVTAIPVPAGTVFSFGSGQSAKCVTYDNAGGTCWEFDVQCTGTDCASNPPTYDAEFATSYDHDDANLGFIKRPGFLKKHTATEPACDGTTTFDTNQIDAFYQNRIDPTTKAKSGGSGSCWAATQDSTDVTLLNFIGFAAPVTNDGLNIVKAGQTIPIKFKVTDANNLPVTNLSLNPPGVVVINSTPITCNSIDVDFTDVVPTVTSGQSGFQNLGSGFYQYNWQTKGIAVGSCRVLQVDLGDHVIHTALFSFTK